MPDVLEAERELALMEHAGRVRVVVAADVVQGRAVEAGIAEAATAGTRVHLGRLGVLRFQRGDPQKGPRSGVALSHCVESALPVAKLGRP